MLEQIRKILKEEMFVEEDINLSSRLKDDLNLDSVAAIELSLQLEEKYNISIKQEELFSLITVDDVIKLLESKGVDNVKREA